jgi:hypothetical protein
LPSCQDKLRALAWQTAFDVATVSSNDDFGATERAKNGLALMAAEVAQSLELLASKQTGWLALRKSAGLMSAEEARAFSLRARIDDAKRKQFMATAIGVLAAVAVGLTVYAITTPSKGSS